jgi:WD40 repeat protein
VEEAEVAQLPVEAAAQLAWSPDGSLLAVSTLEGTDNPFAAESEARIRSRDSRSWTHTLPVGEVWSGPEDSTLAFDANGDTFAATTMDDGVQLWDTSNGRLLRELRAGGQEAYSCAEYSIVFSPDGELVASSGAASRSGT